MNWPEEIDGRDSKLEVPRISNFKFHIPVLAPLALRSDMASSCGEMGIMPQDMGARNLSNIHLTTAANGTVGQAHSPYYPNGLLQKMPYRFIRGCQLLARRAACVLCGWLLSLDVQRSRP